MEEETWLGQDSLFKMKAIWWVERQVWGYDSLPKWLREAYLKACGNECQTCHRKKPLEVNRIIRGNVGGLYTVCALKDKRNNVTIDCKDCHKLKHFSEQGCRNR